MLSTKLKDICNQYGVFILSSTQLNSAYIDTDTPDQNLLRGSKAIADKIDVGMLLLPITGSDFSSLKKSYNMSAFDSPNIKISIYKNRRGRYKGIYLWCKANLGTCRIKPMFATTFNYEPIDIKDIHIVFEKESAF